MGGNRLGRVTIVRKRPKAKSAAIGMAKMGYHDMIIRQNLNMSRSSFNRLKVSIKKDLMNWSDLNEG